MQGGPGGAALSVSTTHMGALTSLKYEDPRFENASVEFDEVRLAPTYRWVECVWVVWFSGVHACNCWVLVLWACRRSVLHGCLVVVWALLPARLS